MTLQKWHGVSTFQERSAVLTGFILSSCLTYTQISALDGLIDSLCRLYEGLQLQSHAGYDRATAVVTGPDVSWKSVIPLIIHIE